MKAKRLAVFLVVMALAIAAAFYIIPSTESAGWCAIEEQQVITRDCTNGEMVECVVYCNPVARGDGSFNCMCLSYCRSLGACDDNV